MSKTLEIKPESTPPQVTNSMLTQTKFIIKNLDTGVYLDDCGSTSGSLNVWEALKFDSYEQAVLFLEGSQPAPNGIMLNSYDHNYQIIQILVK